LARKREEVVEICALDLSELFISGVPRRRGEKKEKKGG